MLHRLVYRKIKKPFTECKTARLPVRGDSQLEKGTAAIRPPVGFTEMLPKPEPAGTHKFYSYPLMTDARDRRANDSETILIVEDDRDLARFIRDTLASQQFTPILAYDGNQGLTEARRSLPSLILMDLTLPVMDGREACRRLRADQKTAPIPIIMLSAKLEEADRIAGLEIGADDYVCKPFSVRELVARIRAILRRRQAQSAERPTCLRVGDLTIDVDRHTVTVGSKSVTLTLTEFSILRHLAQEPGRVFTRTQLGTALWGEDGHPQEHNLEVHIHLIRKKLRPAGGQPHLIQTVRGVGYKLRHDPSRAKRDE